MIERGRHSHEDEGRTVRDEPCSILWKGGGSANGLFYGMEETRPYQSI